MGGGRGISELGAIVVGLDIKERISRYPFFALAGVTTRFILAIYVFPTPAMVRHRP